MSKIFSLDNKRALNKYNIMKTDLESILLVLNKTIDGLDKLRHYRFAQAAFNAAQENRVYTETTLKQINNKIKELQS